MAQPGSQYMKDYRARNPDYVKRQKRLERSRVVAARRLIDRYPSEFEEILEQVRQEMGL